MADEHQEHRKAFTRQRAKAALSGLPEGPRGLLYEAIDRAGFDPSREERLQEIMTHLGATFSYEQLATILASIMADMQPAAVETFIEAMQLIWNVRPDDE